MNLVGILANHFEFDVIQGFVPFLSNTSGLLLVNLNDIVLLHFNIFEGLIIIDALAIKYKSEMKRKRK